jgi:hypothetical protein
MAPQELQLSQSDKPADARVSLGMATPSPYLLESLIDINEEIDLKRIWQMLNVAPPTAEAYRCDGDCEAETFDIATGDEDHPKTVALRISYENRHFYQYLIFKQMASDSLQEGGWMLLGNINCFDQRDAPPRHRIEHGEGRTWLVIKELWKHGAGGLAYGEVWHELQERALMRVLSYPVEGQDRPCQRQPRRSYKTFVMRHDLENGTYTIPIQFLIAYDMDTCGPRDTPLSLFSKGPKAYYVWQAEKGRFVLDEARSGVSEKQLASIADAQPLSDERFVEDNFSELADIATHGDARRKAWLRDFLTSVQNMPRKTDLRRLLQQ